MSVFIKDVEPGSYAKKHGIEPGCTLLKINGHDINDVLDYRFFMVDEVIRVAYKTPDGKFALTKIVKRDEYDDLGLVFDTYLMDKQHSCKNKCIFCFIDQLPKGMRESLYFKDDDSRMSFFYGNYITLTNLKQEDIDRIINMHISPVNVSVHTMNPQLRCKMMNNRFAGDSLKYLEQLASAGITVNTQLVLCPGINDGKELEYSVKELYRYFPAVQSVACVPVGITDYREGLFELHPYTKKQADDTIELINALGEEFKSKGGQRFCYAADEFYLTAERDIPDEDYYEGYPQLDNGVGLMRLFENEVDEAIEDFGEGESEFGDRGRTISIATGFAAYSLIKKLSCKVKDFYNSRISDEKAKIKINVYKIENEFFGSNITVSGLLTGRDLLAQLGDKELGEALLLSESMFRTTYPQDSSDDHVLLDDVTDEDLERQLGIPISVVSNDGHAFVKTILEVGTCQDR